MPRILLVEDDDAIAEPLVRALRRDGYEVARVAAGAPALAAADETMFDLVVLDLGLPDIDGIEVCRRLQTSQPELPLLMLTARAAELDVIVGLDAGAGDYVTKPFRLGELLARVRARVRHSADAQLHEGEVAIDVNARRAWLGNEEMELTAKEFELLVLLVRHAGTVLTREQIMSEVWDEHWFGSTRTLDVHVSTLRRKLGDDPTQPRFVATVRGIGFRFEGA